MKVHVPEFLFAGHDAFSALCKIAIGDDELERVFLSYARSLSDEQRDRLANRLMRRFFAEDARDRGLSWEDAANAMGYLRYNIGEPQASPEVAIAVRRDSQDRKRPAKGESWLDNSSGSEVTIESLATIESGEFAGETAVIVKRVNSMQLPTVYHVDLFLSETRYGDGQWRPLFQKLTPAFHR